MEQILYVEWVDSFEPAVHAPWAAKDDLATCTKERVTVRSVGYLISENKYNIAIAGHNGGNYASGALVIPKCSIIKRKKIRI